MTEPAAASTSDPVARVLLPVLLHEVNNATQLLVGLRAILELPGGEAMFNSRADDLGRTSHMMDDLGFALAVVATAGGANMLLARRDDRSIRILWDLAKKALTRGGGVKIADSGEPPLTAPDALDGWQLAWAVAALLIAASGDDGARAERWVWKWRTTDAGDAELVGFLTEEEGPAMNVLGDGTLALIAERIAPQGSVVAEGQFVRMSLAQAWTREA
jgi:hypothetical protein